jgi:vacuolar-type H+-ATPase subunit F/Vma7
MKAKIIVLGDAPLVMGFRLAGLENHEMVTQEDYQQKLEEYLKREEFGIIITNERMLNSIDWRLKKKLDSIAYPVIIPLPDQEGGSKEGDEIRNLIKRALGFDLGAKK